MTEQHGTTTPLYHGTRLALTVGSLIAPGPRATEGEQNEPGFVLLTANLDEAIWESELAAGDTPGRVYIVEPTGSVHDASTIPARAKVGHPSMSLASTEPLRVIGEVDAWRYYHGTRADLKAGDVIKPGHTPNYGNRARTTTWVYFSRTLDAATWGAELAEGDGAERIYLVEPTGTLEDDPNVTNKRFRGNPTKSFRSRDPLRVVSEIAEWKGHAPEALKAMKEHLARLKAQGVEPLDD